MHDGSKVGARLAEAPAPEILEYLSGPRVVEERDTLFDYMVDANFAHVLMLQRQHIIDPGTADALLEAIQAVEADGAANLAIDPAREDFYFNFEHAIIERTSRDTGGHQQQVAAATTWARP